MSEMLFPTKGNLMQAKSILDLSHQGYQLLDKKKYILMREMMSLIDEAKEIQSHIDSTFQAAYQALKMANITIGISTVEQIGHAVPIEESIQIILKSVMGVEIPVVRVKEKDQNPQYGFFRTSASLDDAYKKFQEVKKLTIQLAEVENAVYKLADNIQKTQRRANALKNINIPKYEKISKYIQNALEEKEREEFTRLKVVKQTKKQENFF